LAKVAKELNLPYCLSTAGSQGSQPIEDVGKANGEGPRVFQLYLPHDDELTVSLLTRAHDSGFSACILTLDTWQLGWRYDDVANSNCAFYHGIGADLGLSDPVFQKRLREAGIDPETMPNKAGAKWIDNVWHGRAHSWEKMLWVMETWRRISGGKPFVLKGIQHVADAKKAVEIGCDGIVVSNHAGRQVDGAIASLDALENYCPRWVRLGAVLWWTLADACFPPAAVGDKTYIMYDSGVRGASDVVKALALGAKFFFVGRLWVWGLSIMGEHGVRHVMKSLLADLDILFNVGGIQSVDQIDKSWLESYSKSYSLIQERSKL
jgi:isopentenyl diphosphate isomerase/L-lactate dehydrogenase-like FMN-dependent dehydrogenase